ncbi:MAG: proteasome-activating nucleotidase [Candidatus Methanoplasma sp.]|jgi:proteasome regulatory subunit|nr:proteasome-activating nucleotidase [Candidatus Methanoplasma sp.]
MGDSEINELKAKIVILEERNVRLMEDLQNAEREKRYSEGELFRVQKDLGRVRSELDKLKSPPLAIGSLHDVLSDNRVVVRGSGNGGSDYIVAVSDYIPKEDLVIGSRVSLSRQSMAVMEILPSPIDPLVSGAEVVEKPTVTYKDVGGLGKQLRELREAVEDPLIRPELYAKVGIDPPRGVLLAGPPGTGKTLMAKAVANATKATFIRLVGSELVQKYIGEGARLVRELFCLAKEKSPCIVFLDELDSIGARRLDGSSSGDREVQRTLMQLLAEMDGFATVNNVRIIGATNRPDILDEALMRPGRFDRIIQVDLPDAAGRAQIFKIHLSRMSVEKGVSPQKLAEKTEGSSGADIKNMCMEAGMFAIRDGRDVVSPADFDLALGKVSAGRIGKTQPAPVHMFG